MKPETLLIHAGRSVDAATSAVTPPIHLASTFERAADGSLPHGFVYTRFGNPTRQALEQALAALEGGVEAAAFGSGSAATTAVLQSLAPGQRLLLPRDCYNGTANLVRQVFAQLDAQFVDMTDLAAVQAALEPAPALVWLETPSNPTLRLTDLAAVSNLVHAVGALVVCDNTWATPLGQRPFDLGVDLVMHSTTKYLGGHSDVLGGALITKTITPWWQRLQQIHVLAGAVPSPFECWLILRGMQSLAYRLRGHCANALAVAEWLAQHPKVQAVHYPGLASHPQYELAQRQMLLMGGMVSFEVVGGAAEAIAVAAQVKLWTRATSLGGPESLIEHRATLEGPDSPTPPALLRLSVGLEHPDDLIADLAQALAVL